MKTIQGIKQNLVWPQLWWKISDDGSSKEHIRAVVDAIGPTYNVDVFDSARRGVGFGMNRCLQSIFETTELVLVMEDDWELRSPLIMSPYVRALTEHTENGMIRFGYLSPNLLGYLFSQEERLFWRLERNEETYRFTGHPSLRHRRFHEAYGWYDEGRPPGLTELSMCGKVNQKPGPNILYPADCGSMGFFAHIGGESLADMEPVK